MRIIGIVFGILMFLLNRTLGADLPDLKVNDIFLAPSLPGYENEDVIFFGTVISNEGANFRGKVSVVCSFSCRGHSQKYIGGMKVQNGIPSRGQVTLGEKSPLDIGDCYFNSRRLFTCSVDDGNIIREIDETNNSLSKTLPTGK